MEYEVVRDRDSVGWRVRAVSSCGPQVTVSFSGPNAHIEALEYAAWKAGKDRMGTLRAVLFSLQIP
jgi:hypothetical protein